MSARRFPPPASLRLHAASLRSRASSRADQWLSSSREAARKRAFDHLAKGQRDAARKYFAKAVDVTPEMCAQFMKVGVWRAAPVLATRPPR